MKDTAGNICGFWQLRSSFSAQAKKAVLQGGHIYFIEQQCKSALNLLYFFSFWSFLQLHCQSHSRYPEANFTSDLIKPCLQLEGRCTRSAAEVKSILGNQEVIHKHWRLLAILWSRSGTILPKWNGIRQGCMFFVISFNHNGKNSPF